MKAIVSKYINNNFAEEIHFPSKKAAKEWLRNLFREYNNKDEYRVSTNCDFTSIIISKRDNDNEYIESNYVLIC